MTPVVIDADAFHCIRSYGLLSELERHVAESSPEQAPLICTGRVARHELSPITHVIQELVERNVLRIQDIVARTPASILRRKIGQRHPGIDRGEAETIAWLLTEPPGTPFVSCDARARRIASREKLFAWDVLDLVHEWLASGVLTLEASKERLVEWVDEPKARWRPRDFSGVESTLRQRYQADYLRPFESRHG